METTKLKLGNRAHCTTCTVELSPIEDGPWVGYHALSAANAKKLRDTLCPDPACTCAGATLVSAFRYDQGHLERIGYDHERQAHVIDVANSVSMKRR
jgi:hypothetical protein